MAGDPGDQPRQGPPAPLQQATAQHPLQPARRRHQRQDRRDVGRVDVLPLQSPVETCHHDGRIATGGQMRRAGHILTGVVGDRERRCRPAQAIQRGDDATGLGPGVGGAPIPEVGHGGEAADDRQGAQARERQHRAFIAQHHDRFTGRPQGQGPMGRAATQGDGVVPRGHPQLQLQLAQHRLIDARHREPPLLHGLLQATRQHHLERHLQIEPRQHGRHAVTHAEDEIAHHKAFEPPALPECRREQAGVLGAPAAVHLVVGAHHGTGAGLDAVAEVGQVELLQHPLTHLDIHQEAAAVDRVESEVLDAGDGVTLQPAGHRCPESAHMDGVFAVGLLGAAPARMAQQIDADRRHPVGTEGAGLQGDRLADALLQLRIPAGAAGDRHREGGGATHQSHTAGTIDELQPRQSQRRPPPRRPWMAMGGIPQGDVGHPRPEGRIAREQGQLLRRAEPCQQRPGLRLRPDDPSGFSHLLTLRRRPR